MYPQPIFTIFGQGVYLYGICMAVGIIACFGFLLFTMWKKKFNEASSDAILFIGIFGTGFGIFAAMLFQSVYNYIEAVKENPSAKFSLGGMTFIGGLIGGVTSFLCVYWLYIYVIRKHCKVKWLTRDMNATLTDALPFIPIGITIAHAFGRLGCFFAGCCYGKPTDAWYGLPCADGYAGNVIPTQLMECFFLVLLSALMAVLYFKYKFNYNFALYAIAYGIWRFMLEFIRADDRGTFIGTALTPSQFWSIIMVLFGIGYVFLQKYVFAKHMKHPELTAENVEEPENGGAEESAQA